MRFTSDMKRAGGLASISSLLPLALASSLERSFLSASSPSPPPPAPVLPPLVLQAFAKQAAESRDLLSATQQPDPSKGPFENVVVALPLSPPMTSYSVGAGNGETEKNLVGERELLRDGRHCIVYGAGIASHSEFEQEMAASGCETHGFDCTVDPGMPAVAGKAFTFHRWCIGVQNEVSFDNNAYVNENNAHVNQSQKAFEFKTFSDTMRVLGHSHVDILKFDIEGFEWELFATELLSSSYLPGQMAFEVHTQGANPEIVPTMNTNGKGFKQVNQLFLALFDLGYRVTSKEINAADHTCAEFVVVNVNTFA